MRTAHQHRFFFFADTRSVPTASPNNPSALAIRRRRGIPACNCMTPWSNLVRFILHPFPSSLSSSSLMQGRPNAAGPCYGPSLLGSVGMSSAVGRNRYTPPQETRLPHRCPRRYQGRGSTAADDKAYSPDPCCTCDLSSFSSFSRQFPLKASAVRRKRGGRQSLLDVTCEQSFGPNLYRTSFASLGILSDQGQRMDFPTRVHELA